MTRRVVVVLCAFALLFISTTNRQVAQRAPVAPLMTADSETALVKQYCVGCHSPATKSGSLVLEGFDFAPLDQHAEVAEKMIRKLRAGLMPPPGNKRPDAATAKAFVTAMETSID